jgi:hypothetical protein
MAKPAVQSYAKHTAWDPITHFILGPIFAINLVLRIYFAIKQPNLDMWWSVVIAAALMILNVKVRVYTLKVQDRIIRLEERLRLSSLLPDPLRSKVNDLTTSQLIALRFASDAEIPPLVEHVISKQMPAKDIKKAIQVWRPDYSRV